MTTGNDCVCGDYKAEIVLGVLLFIFLVGSLKDKCGTKLQRHYFGTKPEMTGWVQGGEERGRSPRLGSSAKTRPHFTSL